MDRSRVSNMSNDRIDKILPALKDALAPAETPEQVTNRIVHLTPEDAREILDKMGYDRQRNVSMRHVGALADMMMNGQWVPGGQITFTLTNGGRIVLVDGQHRLKAAVIANWSGVWCIRAIWNKAAEDIYTTMDTSFKERTAANIGKSLGLDQFSPRMQNLIIQAAAYQNIWRSDYQLPKFCYKPPVRDNVQRVNDRMDSFMMADAIVGNQRATPQIKGRLAVPMAVAVVAETFHANPEEAKEFWTSVVTNGDGVAAELRDRLIERRPLMAAANFTPRLVACGWNQRRTARQLRLENRNDLKVQQTTLVIPA